MKRIALLALALGVFTAAAVHAARPQSDTARTTVPRLIQLSGTLHDIFSRPVAGVTSVTFALYAEENGGTPLWSETQNVLAESNGHYNALLGAATLNGVPSELFGIGESRWLSVTIARQPEMPRILIASVPYALKAADADTLGGLPASAYVTTQTLAAISAKAGVQSSPSPLATGNTATPAASRESTSAIVPAAVSGGGTTDFIPLWTSASALGNSVLFQNAGKIGFNTTAPVQLLDVNGNSIFRGSFQLMPGAVADATRGTASHSMQWNASVFNSSTGTAQNLGFGFRSVPINNNSTTPSAGLDLFYGPGGGTLTDVGVAFGSRGQVSFTPLVGNVGNNNGVTALIVHGSDGGTPTELPINEGGQGIEATGGAGMGNDLPIDGIGGIFTGGKSNLFSEDGDGVEAIAGSGLAGAFVGDVSISGTLSTNGKNFKIDHPQDPAHKYLVHSSVESSEMMNIYTGNVVLDSRGAAQVSLPSWFQAENADFRYSAFPVGAAAPNLYVAEEISGNQFKIAGGNPGQKISWQVTAVRQDAYAVAHPLVVEQDKGARLHGFYLSPELYGQPEEKGLAWGRHPEAMKRIKAFREKQLAARRNQVASVAQATAATP